MQINKGEGHKGFIRAHKIIAVIAGVLLLSIVVFFSFIEYSESPTFCKSCHIMMPYYNAWKASEHNFVPCVECHYPPTNSLESAAWHKIQNFSMVVRYFTKTYDPRPFADIPDASCMRIGCHSTRLLVGSVVTPKGVSFNHVPHMEQIKDIKLRCTSCHSQIVVGRHIEVTYETCFLCHFSKLNNAGNNKQVNNCLQCHQIPKRTIDVNGISYNHLDFMEHNPNIRCIDCHLDVIVGNNAVPRERCYACHNIPARFAYYTDTTFIHEWHVTKHKITCTLCHLEIKHGLETSIKPLEYANNCTLCHSKNMHTAQEDMYMGVGGIGVKGSASPMFKANVKCVGCHKVATQHGLGAKLVGQTYIGGAIGCKTCHGKDYEDIYTMWKTNLQSMTADADRQYAAAKALIDSSDKNSPGYTKALKIYNAAAYNLLFVKTAKGVHNIDYASSLLDSASSGFGQVVDLLKK
ncbi:MAG: NapC/NirT family cytochrome c [Deltaproteobacteria bacterium]|nr:NapC/NirT family cytochrome c [Deltaproteobacteria bacterium]MCL5276487.1 NapC/NirT family cytochrome c [Deltaproteobacteria bacterium]